MKKKYADVVRKAEAICSRLSGANRIQGEIIAARIRTDFQKVELFDRAGNNKRCIYFLESALKNIKKLDALAKYRSNVPKIETCAFNNLGQRLEALKPED